MVLCLLSCPSKTWNTQWIGMGFSQNHVRWQFEIFILIFGLFLVDSKKLECMISTKLQVNIVSNILEQNHFFSHPSARMTIFNMPPYQPTIELDDGSCGNNKKIDPPIMDDMIFAFGFIIKLVIFFTNAPYPCVHLGIYYYMIIDVLAKLFCVVKITYMCVHNLPSLFHCCR